jgi:hypothetical protein
MQEFIHSIIRIGKFDSSFDCRIQSDLKLFSRHGYDGIDIIVPKVRLLKRTLYGKEEFTYKPLLFNYGFVRMPITYSYYYEVLSHLTQVSKTIAGFIFRRKWDLQQERLSAAITTEDRINEESGTIKKPFSQCLLETVSKEEVRSLNNLASNMDVYQCTNELSIGAFVILQGYPFSNLVAQIESKHNTHIKVRLVETDTIVTVTKENLYYTPYLDEDTSREICFTELGCIPEISNEDT